MRVNVMLMKAWSHMQKELIEKLETPCIVINMEQTKRNLRKMQEAADSLGCFLRPHIKTHKMSKFANMQIELGASGITCAKVSEAEVMADGGIKDIFIAYPMVGDFRMKRALLLQKRLDRLILAVDSMECANCLNEAAKKEDTTVEVRLEVDTGAKRTGVIREHVVELGVHISNLSNLNLTGIYTFKSLVYQNEPTEDPEIAGKEEGELMEEIAEALRAANVSITDVSAGSTPTGLIVAGTKKVNEIRPGTYIFNDYMLYKERTANMEEIAVRFYATVVSTPSKEYAVIDGGTKTFPMDILLDMPPYYYPGYALVEGRPDLRLRRMNEEHGIITSDTGDTGLKVGEKICLIPIHVCTAINMQNQVYIYDVDELTVEKVEARGMLV